MRHHKDPTRKTVQAEDSPSRRQPKRKTAQAEDNSSPEDPRNPDSRHKHGGAAPVTWRCTRTEEVHCLRIGCSAPTYKNKRGTGIPNHSPPHPSMRTWALLAAGWARRPRRHLHSGPLQHLPHPYMRRAGFRPQLHPNYEEPLFGKAVGHSRQRRWRRPTRMMETSSCWDRIPILLRSGGVFGPAKARSWIG